VQGCRPDLGERSEALERREGGSYSLSEHSRSLLAALVMGGCVAGQPGRPPPEAVRPTPPSSYLTAKHIAEDRIYPDHRVTPLLRLRVHPGQTNPPRCLRL
jgi:hypothetical protein